MDKFTVETRLGEVFFLNTDYYDQKYWVHRIQNKPNHASFVLECPNCRKGKIFISFSNSTDTQKISHLVDDKEKQRIGGLGLLYHFSTCDNCRKAFYIGLGYIEPNNGREVITLHNVVGLEGLS